MRFSMIRAVVAVSAALSAAVLGSPAVLATPAGSNTTSPAASAAPPVRKVCGGPARPGRMQCDALLRTTADGDPLVTSKGVAPPPDGPGYNPAQLQDAYGLAALAASKGPDRTVAVVDAFDNPNAEADLANYREQYGLPPCTTDNGCFRKVNQNGDPAPLPIPDVGWAIEESLDIDMVSAVCPNCHILLVEADDNTEQNVMASVATAADLGADAISNSYSEPEYPGVGRLEPFYDHPGVLLTAASGDAGYGVGYPAASANVVSVGGTNLFRSAGSRGWTERTWALTGSGCSTQIPKPAWQHDPCTHRMDNDVAAVADPATAVAVYDSYGTYGWLALGGTSASAPIVAGVFALVGSRQEASPSYFYHHQDKLFDVTAGLDGSCSPAYLCTAGPGYDGPTGLGTPNISGIADTGQGTCVGGWSQSPPLETPTPTQIQTTDRLWSRLWDITALSPSNVWTAGNYRQIDFANPTGMWGFFSHIEHWNGSGWHQTPSPNPIPSLAGSWTDIIASSFDAPNDGWAAGFDTLGTATGVMVSHWDGSRWTLSPALQPTEVGLGDDGGHGLASAQASSVAAVSPSDVWIAGNTNTPYVTNYKEFRPLGPSFLEHWDGTTWSLVPVPGDGDGQRIVITGLHAFGTDDIWAVGQRYALDGTATGPVALHWDGQSWQDIPVPVDDADSGFEAVSGTSGHDVWAVGTLIRHDTAHREPLIEHWDGTAWSQFPTVGSDTLPRKAKLFGVTAISPTDAWAVGNYGSFANGQTRLTGIYLLEHWDGQQWTIVPTAQNSIDDGLWAVSASSADNAWIAGGEQVTVADPRFDGFAPYVLRRGCGQ